MQIAQALYLSYCTNIHPANGWPAVLESLRQHAQPLKAALAPGRPFSIGLRLSGEESRELLLGDRLERFAAFLEEHGLAVYLLNGFPYGPFHRTAVKDRVHAPDWRDPERVHYTQRLAAVLTRLLPAGVDGGISTSPLSYKPWLGPGVSAETWTLITEHLVDVVRTLVQVRREEGKHIHLDLEPEPDGLLETSEELADFFGAWLLPIGGRRLAAAAGVSREKAEALILDHVQVCWDTCHVAVAFESPSGVLARYRACGIQVGRVQVSSALKIPLTADVQGREPIRASLTPFAESTYLHQVVQRNRDGALRAYRDLDEALPALNDPLAAEWRVHFHVPVFVEDFGTFGSTQDSILDTFALRHRTPFTRHFEIETYTWEVLPPHLKRPLGESIRREYEWVLARAAAQARHA